MARFQQYFPVYFHCVLAKIAIIVIIMIIIIIVLITTNKTMYHKI